MPQRSRGEPIPSREELRAPAEWIRAATSVVALTGAGVSTDSGIPDFRGPRGVWTKNPGAERLSNIEDYMNDRQVRLLSWRARLEHPAWSASPNAGHAALAELERRGGLQALVTQNIDGLHQMAGSSEDVVIEMHGTMREVMCMRCGERAPMERALERVRKGEEDPHCRRCGGILKSSTISFGQSLDADKVARALRVVRDCDLLLAIGSSLVVNPVAQLPGHALAAGARLVIMNAEPTPYDDRAHAVVRAPLSRSLPALVELV